MWQLEGKSLILEIGTGELKIEQTKDTIHVKLGDFSVQYPQTKEGRNKIAEFINVLAKNRGREKGNFYYWDMAEFFQAKVGLSYPGTKDMLIRMSDGLASDLDGLESWYEDKCNDDRYREILKEFEMPQPISRIIDLSQQLFSIESAI